MLEKKKILFLVEALSCGIFTYIVDLANGLVDSFDIYIVHAIRPQTPKNYKDYFDKRVKLIKVENLRREIKPAQELKAIKEVREIAEQLNQILFIYTVPRQVLLDDLLSMAKMFLFFIHLMVIVF